MLVTILLKIALWLYAVTGTLYFFMYAAENEVVMQHAVGILWLLMMAAPAALSLLILYPVAKRFGLLPED